MPLSVSVLRLWSAIQPLVKKSKPSFSILAPTIMIKCGQSVTTLKSASIKSLSVLLLLVERKITFVQWINLQRNSPS